MREEGVDQGAVGVSRRRVDDEPGRLVDDQEMRVLVADIEAHRLRQRAVGGRGGDGDHEGLPRFYPHGGGRYRRARLPETPLAEEKLPPAWRAIWRRCRPHALA